MPEATVTLRPATEADLPFLLALREATMTEHLLRAGEPTDSASHAARVRARLDDAQIVCLDGAPAGLLKAYREPDSWVVMQIQILPAHQRQGVGARVLRRVLDEADRQRVPVSLKVLKGNPAQRLYERLGFRIAAEVDAEYLLTRPA
ncbi:GNAT family N-acetyltransferase [Burkholderia sp. FERM BP-3421]|jgi:ribosomal protein S18 acetylase RimI-like enzyme|uniref:GNAT family N-acetyltransferase n=1 Tax=Burkholderia sp. FERM BP-3421 TaxID=1494466 RepID=UPI002361A586|nr:GNAT family N-acetyltransferase [Burkholderia sp. FERM BP-3421]WDD91726.1 GNAT family N-acetyltransferase [Burkholderia sp. FERM BP-3421]